jgi:ketosteroid isomerase-like protein
MLGSTLEVEAARSERRASMAEVDEFLAETLPRQIEAEKALHNGDVTPRLEMWSANDPVTLLGAFGLAKSGWDEISEAFRWVASRFSNLAEYDFELVAAGASGDLAYTVGYERHSVSIEGGPVKPHTLRVTHVYRRENGEWKVVHRHGDEVPVRDIPEKAL